VDVLRALAVSLVLLHHLDIGVLVDGTAWLRPVKLLHEAGFLGISLFLVLSGFSIHLRVASGGAFASFHGGLSVIGIVIVAVEGRPNQLAVRESFLLERTFRWHRIDDILHGTTTYTHPVRRPPHSFCVCGNKAWTFI
jgi:hypothetical protein